VSPACQCLREPSVAGLMAVRRGKLLSLLS
jgi:hypothetical protein